MSTIIILCTYIGFAVYRHYNDAAKARNQEMQRASDHAEMVRLRDRISAIEDALRSSPFVTFGRI